MHSRWILEGKKPSGWMNEICFFFQCLFSVFWAQWELVRLKGLWGRETQERRNCSALILGLEMSLFVPPKNPPGAAACLGVGVSVWIIPIEEGRAIPALIPAVGKGLKRAAKFQSLLFPPHLEFFILIF